MTTSRKIATVFLTLLAVMLNTAGFIAGVAAAAIFAGRLRALGPDAREVFQYSLRVYLIAFASVMSLGVMASYLEYSGLFSTSRLGPLFRVPFGMFFLFYAIVYKLINVGGTNDRCESRNGLLKAARHSFILILVCFGAMVLVGVRSASLWERLLAWPKPLVVILLLPSVVGVLRSKDSSCRWGSLKLLVYSYYAFILMNVSKLIGKTGLELVEVILRNLG